MSTDADQTKIGEFETPKRVKRRPKWKPQEDDETDTGHRVRCRSCGATVSAQFARVFGDNDDRIDACLSCSSSREIYGNGNRYGSGVGGGRL